MRFLVFLVILIIVQSCLLNRTHYTGYVCDAATKKPLAGVKVTELESQQYTFTDEKGFFTLKKMDDIASRLIFEKEPYIKDTLSSVLIQHGEHFEFLFKGEQIYLRTIQYMDSIYNDYEKSLYKSTNPREQILPKDSLIIRGKDTAVVTRLRIYHYPEEQLITKDYIGYYKGEKPRKNSHYIEKHTLRTYFIRQGKLSTETIYFPKKDSLIYDRDTVRCESLFIRYDLEGNIKEKICEGNFSCPDIAAHTRMGTAFFYKGDKLIQEKYYHNDRREKDYIRHRVYDTMGNYREIYTNNYELFNNDSLILSPEEVRRRTKR